MMVPYLVVFMEINDIKFSGDKIEGIKTNGDKIECVRTAST